MAEGLLRKWSGEKGLGLEVRSAGLAAFPGVPPAPEALEACREKGVDISGHASRPLDKSLVLDSDLILTMTRKHREMIVRKMPASEPKVFLFSEYAGAGSGDVEDPVGLPLEAYRAALGQMEEYLEKSLEKMRKP
jgi:protein arginine phosphatase